MALFEKKNCARCGKELGLLFGKTKIKDGTICKDCNALLSPLLTNKSALTLADIEKHIAYRNENAKKIASFRLTKVIGSGTKIYFDTNAKNFVVYKDNTYIKNNADLFSFSQVTFAQVQIDKEEVEETYEDKEGNTVSYSPARYKTEYTYKVKVKLNHPWIKELEVLINDEPVSDRTEILKADNSAYEAVALMTGKSFTPKTIATLATSSATRLNTSSSVTSSLSSWTCSCGHSNPSSSNFCSNCGKAKTSAKFCPECGTKLEAGTKFCPNCGKAVNG